jgi:hypothetical protein
MEVNMISFEDCIALCGLNAEEVAAIAEHEHIPEMAATNLARYLLDHARGPEEIRGMIIDDIRTAVIEKQTRHAAELLSALRHFLQSHPRGESLANPSARLN